MKTAILVCLGLLLVAAIYPQGVNKTDLEKDGLRGRVRSCKVEKAGVVQQSGKWVEGRKTMVVEKTYDTQGNLIEWLLYAPDG